ncbi:PEX5- protein [Homalodisca vitripennis]|nr:PEX5- protein [Homalodisca vitripennis]
MALRDLVEGECGGANSLVRLTSHIVQDRGLKDEGLRHTFPHGEGFSSSNADQLVQQFFEETLGQATPTFRMDSLLAEMRDLERGLGTGPPIPSTPIAQLAAEQDVSCWAEQYLDSGKHFQESNQDSIWSTPQPGAPPPTKDTFELGFGPNWAKEYLQSTSEQLHLDEPEVNLTELGASEEYLAENTKDDSELKATANEILRTTSEDPKFNYSKFMKFMRQIGEGEVVIEDREVHDFSDDFASSWLQELEDYKQEIFDEKWKEASDTIDRSIGAGDIRNDVSNLRNVSLTKENEDSSFSLHPWTQDYTEYIDFASNLNKYKFSEENPMTDLPDAVAEGQKRLAAGDIPSAVLCFEAAVKTDPSNQLAWQLLGVTQAENEQDPQAIAAFKQCLELDPNNLTALMGLAVSYTNENFDHHACRALKDWLRVNPKYSDLVPQDDTLKLGGQSMLTTMDLHKEVCDKFISAARRNPQDIDPDVQCGLGVLFNLTNEQDKAVDCFKSALQVRPNDFTMWNRLGATLANGGRPEEAVDAYHNALQLYPGFIRARYNLGITCTHLGAHKAAVEHFLSALNQQAAGRGVQGERSMAMSDTIWTTLRVVMTFLDQPELVQAVNDRDLQRLNREFIETGEHLS